MANEQTYTIAGCAGCCQACTPSATSCNDCTDITPSQYIVTFSEVQMCGCSNGAGSSIKVEWVGGSELVNGSHTLTHDPSTCQWTKTISNAVKLSYYFSALSCAGTPDYVENNMDVVIELSVNNTTNEWSLDCYPLGAATPARFFQDLDAPAIMDGASLLCSEVPSFENNRTRCDELDIDTVAYGYDGSATVVCV